MESTNLWTLRQSTSYNNIGSQRRIDQHLQRDSCLKASIVRTRNNTVLQRLLHVTSLHPQVIPTCRAHFLQHFDDDPGPAAATEPLRESSAIVAATFIARIQKEYEYGLKDRHLPEKVCRVSEVYLLVK